MRPAKLSRDPGYGLSDPGAEYVEDVLGCWLGPLAARLGVEGKEATLQARTNVYNGLDPSGRVKLFHVDNPKKFRPVIGGNFHTPKSLNAWLAFQTDETRKKVERAYAEEVVATVKAKVLPDLFARAKKGGKELQPAELMFFVDKHVTGSAGNYGLHYQVSIVNRGRCKDAVFRALDSSPLFKKQQEHAVDLDSRIAPRLNAEFGLRLKPGPNGTLEVEGLEGFRRVETPMRERIFKALRDARREVTAKAVHFEALRQRGVNRVRVTTQAALATTRLWVHGAGIDVGKAVIRRAEQTNELVRTKLAETAVRRARKLVDRIGVPVTKSEFQLIAKAEGTRLFVNPARIDARVAEVFREPTVHGLFPAGPGRVTTSGIEAARQRADAAVSKMAKRRARQPSRKALASLHIGPTPLPAHHAAILRTFKQRATRLDAPTPALKHLVYAHQLDGRRVFAAATPQTAREFGKTVEVAPQHPEVLAARLGKPGMWKTFIRLRSSARWRSFDHFAEVLKAARQPDLKLGRDDVVVLDARHASQRAVATICRAARKGRANLVLINNPADEPTRTRGPGSRSHNP